MSVKMVNRKSWKEFRDTGLVLIINQLLHVFGWAIVFVVDEKGNVSEVFPARVKCRGFSEESVDTAYKKVTEYLVNNVEELEKEVDDNNGKRNLY